MAGFLSRAPGREPGCLGFRRGLGIAPGNRAAFTVGETRQAFERTSKATKRFRLGGSGRDAAFWEAGDQAPAPKRTLPPA